MPAPYSTTPISRYPRGSTGSCGCWWSRPICIACTVLRREHDSNYGFNLSVWDRLFRTYTAQPQAGHQGMTIGLDPYQSEAPTRFGWSLWLPFGPQPSAARHKENRKPPAPPRQADH